MYPESAKITDAGGGYDRRHHQSARPPSRPWYTQNALRSSTKTSPYSLLSLRPQQQGERHLIYGAKRWAGKGGACMGVQGLGAESTGNATLNKDNI